MKNLTSVEILLALFGISVFVLWILGVLRLFRKGYPGWAWVAIVGIIFPVVALVGFAGWFMDERIEA